MPGAHPDVHVITALYYSSITTLLILVITFTIMITFVIRSDIQTYMYTGRLNVRPEHAIEALSVCTYYQIEPLVRAYSVFSESYLKIDTV